LHGRGIYTGDVERVSRPACARGCGGPTRSGSRTLDGNLVEVVHERCVRVRRNSRTGHATVTTTWWRSRPSTNRCPTSCSQRRRGAADGSGSGA